MITKIKTVASTSKVDFQNVSRSFYDMIIMIQNPSVDQTINFVDIEGNQINDQPIILSQSCKIILKNQQIGSLTFSDSNIYNIIISYSVRRESLGIPYIDIDYASANVFTQNLKKPSTYQNTFKDYVLISPVPAGKAWKIKSIAMLFEASATQTDYLAVAIIPPNNINGQYGLVANDENTYQIYADSLAATSGDDYSLLLSTITQNQAVSLQGGTHTIASLLPSEIEVFENYGIYLQTTELTNLTYYTIEYTEENAI